MTTTETHDDLEYWRGRALAQAEEITAHGETIRRLCRARDSLTPMTGCPEHGPELARLWAEMDELGGRADRTGRACGVLAINANTLAFLTPSRLDQLTPDRLTAWVTEAAARAARIAGDLPEPAPDTPTRTAEDRPPSSAHDPRTTVAYWRGVALRQTDVITGHPEILDRYTRERDEAVARNSRCDTHVQALTEARDHVTRLGTEAARNEKAYQILHEWFAGLLAAAETGVPADLPQQARRTGDRAHRVRSA